MPAHDTLLGRSRLERGALTASALREAEEDRDRSGPTTGRGPSAPRSRGRGAGGPGVGGHAQRQLRGAAPASGPDALARVQPAVARREGMLPKRTRRARAPADEERVDMEAWQRAEAQAWEKVEDGRWLGFWRLETRARKECADLRKRQEDMRQRLDRESRTVLGRLRI